MRLVFLGSPGAGKGTQAHILESQFGVHQISTGDILRENRGAGTELGRQAEGYMQRGELVPDELIIKMIEAALQRQAANGFIMDGFPRTVAQAQAFDDLLARRSLTLDAVVLFNADRETLMTRLTSRWTNPRTGKVYNTITAPPTTAGHCDDDGGQLVQREDDRPGTVAKRLDVYDLQTKPLVEYYRNRGKLVEVDGLQAIDTVTREILGKVQVDA
ncbi:MAG: adenylate kinase [Candidatus Eremiobacteraeota bacterium]|nr:adenylate kinase [Candidatus Eremiobacteraeota bacterium]